MRNLKDFFTLEEVKNLPEFVQQQIISPQQKQHNDRVEKIKDMLSKGYNQNDIAKELNISRQAVSEFIKKHIRNN